MWLTNTTGKCLVEFQQLVVVCVHLLSPNPFGRGDVDSVQILEIYTLERRTQYSSNGLTGITQSPHNLIAHLFAFMTGEHPRPLVDSCRLRLATIP